MTLMTTETPHDPLRTFAFGWRHRVLTWLEQALETPASRRLRARSARIAALRALTDEQLADRNLTRDQIVSHVFYDQVR